jgi:ring-1,2-phenylacetyl-CoA epoxidase subunit PaaE
VTQLPAAHRGFAWLRVAAVDRLCADAVAITFAVPPDLAELYRHRPGQAVTLRRTWDGRDERRSYSVCAALGDPLRVGVREVSGGALSGWLTREVRPGDQIEVSRPVGQFTPDLSTPARHALIAAGSGITPLLSIASSVVAADERSSVVVIYGNRSAATVMFADELADLKDSDPRRVELIHLLSREAPEVELFAGRLDAARLTDLLPLIGGGEGIDHWWLCGPHAMVEAITGALDRLGVEPARIHRELFWVEDAPPEPVVRDDGPPVVGATVTITLDGRSTTVTVPAGAAILDAGQRVRGDLPFACKGGVCGTCRALVTDGTVRMRRNFALEPAEVEAGYALTCQAVPASDWVTVDFDS